MKVFENSIIKGARILINVLVFLLMFPFEDFVLPLQQIFIAQVICDVQAVLYVRTTDPGTPVQTADFG